MMKLVGINNKSVNFWRSRDFRCEPARVAWRRHLDQNLECYESFINVCQFAVSQCVSMGRTTKGLQSFIIQMAATTTMATKRPDESVSESEQTDKSESNVPVRFYLFMPREGLSTIFCFVIPNKYRIVRNSARVSFHFACKVIILTVILLPMREISHSIGIQFTKH